MAAPLTPGDFVECLIDADFGFRRGKLYCVADVGPVVHCQACGKTEHGGLRFADPVAKPGAWWAGCRFRPIYRRKQGVIEALKAPVTRTPKVVRDRSREDA